MARVLIIRLSSFGDVAQLVPAVYSVASKYPQDRFTVLTRRSFAPLFENLNFNVNVMAFDPHKKHKGALGLIRLVFNVLGKGFSHVADEHDVLRTKVIRSALFLFGRKVAHLNKSRKGKNSIVKSKDTTQDIKPVVDSYMEVLAQLGFGAPIIFNNFFDFIPRDFGKIKSIVPEKVGTWIAVAPFAKHDEKTYPLSKMEKVVETLSKRPNTTVFLIGAGKREGSFLNEWVGKYPNTINIAGKVSLEKELLLISFMDVMVSMDSANMHLASLVQIPVVSIWGATHPVMGFYGFGQDINNAVQIDLECRPCSVYGENACSRGDHACMEKLPEDMIVQKVNNILLEKQKLAE